MASKNRPRSPDAVIAVLAARQHGVVARRQLLALGVSADAIALRLAAERLCPIHRGVYAVGHPALTAEGRWLGAVLACGDGAALSHRAGAALWAMRQEWRDLLEVSGARTLTGRPGIIVHRPRRLPEEDCTVLFGIPVTTVSRTLVDLADVVRPRLLQRLLEQAEIMRLDASPVPIPGRRGAGRLRRALLAHSPVVQLTRSELEARFLELCRDAGLPPPRANVVIEGMEVDFCWPDRRLIVETDGWAYHGTRAAFSRDRRRSVELTVAGWTVVRFTYEDVVHDPNHVVHTLRRLGVGGFSSA